MEEYEEAKVRIIIGPSFEDFYHSQRDKWKKRVSFFFTWLAILKQKEICERF